MQVKKSLYLAGQDSSNSEIEAIYSSSISDSKEMATHLIESLNGVAIMTTDLDFKVSFANSYAIEILHLNKVNSINGKGILPSTILKRLNREMKASNHEFNLQYRNKSQLRILNVLATCLTSEKGEHYGYVFHMHDITNRISIEQQLRNTENFLRNLINASPDFIYFKDEKNRWIDINKSGLDLFQLNKIPYHQKSDLELANLANPVFKESFAKSSLSDEQALNEKNLIRKEEVISIPQGGEKVFDIIKIPLFHDDGSRQGVVTLGRDITERKMAETNLRDRSAILDALISCDWLLHSTESWQTVAVKVLEQICLASHFSRATLFQNIKADLDTGIQSRKEFQWSMPGHIGLGKHYSSINFKRDGCNKWPEIFMQGLPVYGNTSKFDPEEQKFLSLHGTKSFIALPIFSGSHWWGILLIERESSLHQISSYEIEALMAVGRSLGVSILREMTNKRLNQAKLAFDSASEGIMILDENCNIVAINEGFSKITGYTEHEVLGYTPKVMKFADKNILNSLKSCGKWQGEVTNQRKNGEMYQEWLTLTIAKNNFGKVVNYVGVFADITKIKQSQNQLNQLVNHDPLTGLPNRRLLNELLDLSIKQAERENGKIALLFIDLDRFKAINDTLGHHVGDKLLYEVSRRISRSIRDSDVVARLGGDEFVVMMNKLNDHEDAAMVAKKIIHSLQIEFIIDNKELFIGASIGISVFPRDNRDVDGLLKAADIAMYQVKNGGKNSFAFYSPELSKKAVERFTVETQLRRALERNQFEVYYQPQVSLIDGTILGAEALIRWNHPELGLVSPAKFIPVAEETGLIVQIGEWVLRQAASQATLWINQGLSIRWVSVNVSGLQIMRSNFADTVYGLIIETDCDPSIIELEITESTVMQNTEFVIETFERIKKMGVRLAIDDFGTGYSSLSHLKRLPLDKIKIDQSFIRDLPEDADDAAIANAIYAMATSLGFSVIAEGVETLEQAEFLKNMGCNEAQGYLYGKPVKADDFTKLLELKMRGNNHVI